MFDIHCQLKGDIIRKQFESPTLKEAIVLAGAKAIREPGEWTVVYKKTGKIYLKLQGIHE